MTHNSQLARVACVVVFQLTLASHSAAQAALPAPELRGSWRERLGFTVGGGVFSPTGNSQLYWLLNRALTPGSDILQPRLLSGSIQYGVSPTVAVVLRADVGSHSSRTHSIAAPSTPAADLSQRTTLRIRMQSTLGAQFAPWQWRGPTAAHDDRLRLNVGAGGGLASYQLDQRGTFVDADRALSYGASYRSLGTGLVSYAMASVDIPIVRVAAVSVSLRKQWGSARMTRDYSSFDRLDLGGTTASLGMMLRPFRKNR